ncbi:MAG TPA: hypothetical protein VGD97_07380 [Lacunisphaera sp.]
MPSRNRTVPCLTALLLGVMLSAGCATSGPNHVYLTTAASPAVQDLGPASASLADAVKPDEQVLGLAYDFNTDHLFVRVVPAQVIRVIERPSGKILREMPLPVSLQATTSADLAIRSSDRHLFAVHPDGRSVVELTLFGETIRRIELTGLAGPVGGIAYDQRGGRLLILSVTGNRAQVGALTPGGNVTYHVTLAAAVSPVSLGYDSDAQHCFVPLADGVSLGEFDAAGNLVATHPAVGAGAITGIDAGPRSFVRVF